MEMEERNGEGPPQKGEEPEREREREGEHGNYWQNTYINEVQMES